MENRPHDRARPVGASLCPPGLERVQLENAFEDRRAESLPNRKRLARKQLLQRVAAADDDVARRRIAEPGKYIGDGSGATGVPMLEYEPPSSRIDNLGGAEFPAAENADDAQLEVVFAIDAFGEPSVVDRKLVTSSGDRQRLEVARRSKKSLTPSAAVRALPPRAAARAGSAA